MSSKYIKLTFWAATGLFTSVMALSAVLYLTSPDAQQSFVHLGFPSYFRIELALFKFAGVVVLLAPFPALLKEWAYAGFFITLISAFTAHVSRGDGPDKFMAPVIFAGILAASYWARRKLNARNINN
ncbi:MAG: DoxX family protein [Bdellovibrionales bacterium]